MSEEGSKGGMERGSDAEVSGRPSGLVKSDEGGFSAFVNRPIWAIFAPRKLFSDIERGGAPWWQGWFWLGILNVILAKVSIPIQLAVTRLNPGNLPEEQLEKTIENFEKFQNLGLVLAPISVIILGVIFALITYLAVSILAERANFKKYFSLYLFASIVYTIGSLMSLILVRLRGTETIRSIEDATVSFGPKLFVPPGQKILSGVLASFDLFAIWFYVLIAMGVMHIFKLSRASAIVVIVPVWLLVVLLSLLGAAFGAGF